jgi:hypothetical protein
MLLRSRYSGEERGRRSSPDPREPTRARRPRLIPRKAIALRLRLLAVRGERRAFALVRDVLVLVGRALAFPRCMLRFERRVLAPRRCLRGARARFRVREAPLRLRELRPQLVAAAEIANPTTGATASTIPVSAPATRGEAKSGATRASVTIATVREERSATGNLLHGGP